MDSCKWKENNRTVLKKKKNFVFHILERIKEWLYETNYKTKASKNEIKQEQVAMKKNHFKLLAIRWHWNFKTQ